LAALAACAFIGALLIVPAGEGAVPEVPHDQMSAAAERPDFELRGFQPQATFGAKLEGALERKPPVNALASTDLASDPVKEFIVLAEIENQLAQAIGPTKVGRDVETRNADVPRGRQALRIPPHIETGGSSRLTKLEPPRGYH